MLDEAESKPESAHQALTSALASETSSAERMLWWLAMRPRPATSGALDALSDAWFVSEAPRTRLLLAIALALFNYADSCPVELGSDGACRMPGSSLGQVHDSLIRRDGIALERANEWTHRARALAKRARAHVDDRRLRVVVGGTDAPGSRAQVSRRRESSSRSGRALDERPSSSSATLASSARAMSCCSGVPRRLSSKTPAMAIRDGMANVCT